MTLGRMPLFVDFVNDNVFAAIRSSNDNKQELAAPWRCDFCAAMRSSKREKIVKREEFYDVKEDTFRLASEKVSILIMEEDNLTSSLRSWVEGEFDKVDEAFWEIMVEMTSLVKD